MVACCTLRDWDHVATDEFRHFVTNSTYKPVSVDRQIQKDITLLFCFMLASKTHKYSLYFSDTFLTKFLPATPLAVCTDSEYRLFIVFSSHTSI